MIAKTIKEGRAKVEEKRATEIAIKLRIALDDMSIESISKRVTEANKNSDMNDSNREKFNPATVTTYLKYCIDHSAEIAEFKEVDEKKKIAAYLNDYAKLIRPKYAELSQYIQNFLNDFLLQIDSGLPVSKEKILSRFAESGFAQLPRSTGYYAHDNPIYKDALTFCYEVYSTVELQRRRDLAKAAKLINYIVMRLEDSKQDKDFLEMIYPMRDKLYSHLGWSIPRRL